MGRLIKLAEVFLAFLSFLSKKYFEIMWGASEDVDGEGGRHLRHKPVIPFFLNIKVTGLYVSTLNCGFASRSHRRLPKTGQFHLILNSSWIMYYCGGNLSYHFAPAQRDFSLVAHS